MSDDSFSLVSIIVPAYNIEKYIAQTLQAIVDQTYSTLEIIVVNDGSTDSTADIAALYAKKDPRVTVVSQENKGLSAARNTGLRLAKGKYVCIIDADDIMMPNKIASQTAFLESHPTDDFTYSKVRYFIDGTTDIYIRDLATPDGNKVHSLLLQKGNLISPNSVFFRKSVFDTVGGFDESLRSAEDLDYWLFLSGKGVNFKHQDEYLTLCRARQDSLTADNVTLYTCVVKVFEKHMKPSLWPNRQYIKNRILLRLALWRKPSSVAGTSNTSRKHSSLRVWFNSFYQFLRKMKFRLTFRRVHDQQLEAYLKMIEQKAYGYTH